MARKKNTSIYVAALFLFLGGVGYLVYSGFSENSVYFLNVAEAKAATPDKLTAARLFGTVASRGIEKHRGGPGVTFSLEDKDNASQIVEGGMGPGGHFAAKTLMTKCPSKYQKENRTS